jgi:hypothetical protein
MTRSRVAAADVVDAFADAGIDAVVDAPPFPDLAEQDGPQAFELTPAQGPHGGLTLVTIQGVGLSEVTQVRFGDIEGLDVVVLDDQTLTVRTPPHPAGKVDVLLRAPGYIDHVMPAAFRFVAPVVLDTVAPGLGPAHGGTTVTVTGAGFAPSTQFLVGDRLALAPTVLDEHTAGFLTPPGTAGLARVVAVTPDGTAQLPAAFEYRAVPKLDWAAPGIGPLSGGTQLTLHGEGLSTTGTQVWLSRSPTPGSESDAKVGCTVLGSSDGGQTLTVETQAAVLPGLYDVALAAPGGAAKLQSAFTYVDPVAPQPVLAVVGITPPQRPRNQLGPVAVALQCDPSATKWALLKVQFGGQPAKVLKILEVGKLGATVLVEPPPVPPGQSVPWTVPVSVMTGEGLIAQQAQAFTWLPPVPEVVAVAPQLLDTTGGTPLTIEVAFLPPTAKVQAIRIGALLASGQALLASGQQVTADAPTVLQVKAPPGSPGPADVTVLLANGQTITRKSAVTFATAKPQLVAVLPDRGARAGGTWLDVYGAGLDGCKTLLVGGAPATDLTIIDGSHLRVRTPPGEPGPADVKALFAGGLQSVLPGTFQYFDPAVAGTLTWGQPIDGALNVTVYEKGKLSVPLADALVLLGADKASGVWGYTDPQGQVTLSTPGLHGPVQVHATKAGYGAASVVALTTENVILRLTPLPQPKSGEGSGQPPETPDDMHAEVTGTVVDADKYVQLPPGSCAGKSDTDGSCAPCEVDADCAANLVCAVLQVPGLGATAVADTDGGANTPGSKFCLKPCAASAECAASDECRMVGATFAQAAPRCVPRVGTPQVRCQSAAPSIFGGGDSAVVDAKGHFQVDSAPGDAAIICRAGYVDAQSKVFVPMAMGIARHIVLAPHELRTGVVVPIRVPLDRRVKVRMDRVPLGADAVGGLRQLTAGLDLGSEGYVPLGTLATKAMTDTFVLERQPDPGALTGDLADIRYELYGGVGNSYGGPPLSQAQALRLDPRGLERVVRRTPGSMALTVEPMATGALFATAAAGADRVAVGAQGKLLQWTGGGFTAQPSPTKRDLRAVWLAPGGGDGWAGGDDGVLLRRQSLGWSLWPAQLPQTVVALAGRATNDVWAADNHAQLHHWDGVAWQPVPGPWPPAQAIEPALPQGAAPAKKVRALWQSPSGALWLAGDAGTLLRRQVDGSFIAVPTGFNGSVRALFGFTTPGSSTDTLWVAGDQGYLAQWHGQTLTPWKTGTAQPLYGLRSEGPGFPLEVVGGRGTWLRVADGQVQVSQAPVALDLRGLLPTFDGGLVAVGEPVLVMGPYLEMPHIQLPAANQTLGAKLTWTANAGLTPSMNLVRIADAAYQTRWEMYVRGPLFEVDLPDFSAFGPIDPLPNGQVVVRLWRINAPGLDVDHLEQKDLSQWTWISWAYDVQNAKHTKLLPPAPEPGLP